MRDPVDELYTLPAAGFIPARDRLASKLAAAGDAARAREVKALRRPTVAAWVVNQLAHRHAAALRRLVASGDALRRAQRGVVRGGDGDDLRAAGKARQEALRELRGLAVPFLRTAGSGAHLDDVLATLEAASVEPEAARAVSAGRLTRELKRPAGFGDTTAPLTLLVSPRAVGGRPSAADKTRATDADRHARRRALATEAKRLEREAARSARTAAKAAKQSEVLERTRNEQQRRVETLRTELQAAEERLATVDRDLRRVRAEAARAAAGADDLRRKAEAARAGTDD